MYNISDRKNDDVNDINDAMDFSFVIDMIKDKYSPTMARTSEDETRLFKHLLLKSYFKLSGRDLMKK